MSARLREARIELTPRVIFDRLDEYVIGQTRAKRVDEVEHVFTDDGPRAAVRFAVDQQLGARGLRGVLEAVCRASRSIPPMSKNVSKNASPMPSPRVSSLVSCALLFAALASAGCPKKAPPPPLPPPTPDEVVTAGKALLSAYEKAYESREVASLSELYAHDLDVMVIVQGKAHRGWSNVETYVNGFVTKADSVRLDVTGVHVVALGDGAADVHAGLRREYSEGSATRTEVGSLTLGLTRIDARWVIRTEHFSYGLR